MSDARDNSSKSNRVLVVRAGALGDTLMVTPLIRRLREANPERPIDALVSAGGAQILASNPCLSQRHVLRYRNVPYLLSPEKQNLARLLRESGYEEAILLESAPTYREILDKAGIPLIHSFSETRFDPAQHAIVNNLACGGFTELNPAAFDMDLPVTPEATAWASHKLEDLPRPVIGIHSGYGPLSKKKNQTERLRGWSPAKFVAVAQALLAQTGGSVVLTGAAEDRPVCEDIARELPAERTLIAAGETSIPQLVGLIAALNLLISVDSGPAHIAAAVGTPLVVLWGPGILSQTRPISSSTPIQIINAAVPCAPCYGTPLMKQCQRNICMERIEAPQVISAALQRLAEVSHRL